MKWSLAVAVLLTCITSCAARQAGQQTEVGTAAFEACREYVCPPRVEVTIQERCLADRSDQYAKLPSSSARLRFLLEAGCPEAVARGR